MSENAYKPLRLSVRLEDPSLGLVFIHSGAVDERLVPGRLLDDMAEQVVVNAVRGCLEERRKVLAVPPAPDEHETQLEAKTPKCTCCDNEGALLMAGSGLPICQACSDRCEALRKRTGAGWCETFADPPKAAKGGPATVAPCRPEDAEVAAQAQEVLNAEMASVQQLREADKAFMGPAPAECDCGGPAGHVPGGVRCRRGA